MEESILRILDANLNRAREALRVIEDHARFALDDAAAVSTIKALRHELRSIASACGPDALLAARDIGNDVGAEVKTARELRRETVDDVLRAAFGRLTEAARVLGEYAKLAHPTAAATAETLRYRAYDLEQQLAARGTRRRRFRAADLYVILSETFCRFGWIETAEAVLAGGATCLQLREKLLDDAELLSRACRLRALTRDHDALLIINDRPDIARLAGADGVHVGQEDLSVAQVRRIAGGNLLVGKSTHTPEQFAAALDEKPDYLAVGPMFPTATKPQEHIAGVETLRAVRPLTELPIVAIGGITPDRVATVRAAGADCVCACSAIIRAEDPAAVARDFLATVAT